MIYTRRKIQISRDREGHEYLTVTIPKSFGDMWRALGATHCILDYSDDNTIKMLPEMEQDGKYVRLS